MNNNLNFAPTPNFEENIKLGYPQSLINLVKTKMPKQFHDDFEIFVKTGSAKDDKEFRHFLESEEGQFLTNIILYAQLEILKIHVNQFSQQLNKPNLFKEFFSLFKGNS